MFRFNAGTSNLILAFIQRQAVIVLLNIFFFISGYAQEFRLDTTFGKQGIVTTQTKHTSEVYSIKIDPSQRVIAAGYSNHNGNQLCAYFPNGDLDPSFGEDGIVNSDLINEGIPLTMFIQPDGKIVTGGYYQGNDAPPHRSFSFLMRFLPDGSYDPTFGLNGAVKIVLDSTENGILAMQLQSDGKIVAGGHIGTRSLLMRFNSDGSFDDSFGDEGKIYGPIETESYINDLTLQDDGKILTTGSIGEAPQYQLTLVRYNSDGQLDHAFGTDGYIFKEIEPSPFTGTKGLNVKLTESKSILVIGSSRGLLLMLKYKTSGEPDSTFAENGVYYSDSIRSVSDLVILPNNKIVLSGHREVTPFNYGFNLIRFQENGVLDTSFGVSGQITLDITQENDYPHCLELTSKEEIIAAGSVRDSAFVPAKFALVKYVFDGANSISDAKSQKPWAIYPNPSASYFTLRSNQTITKHHRIELFNALGQSVLKQNISSPTTSVDVRNLPKGMYFYKLFSSKDIVQQGKIEKR